MKIDFSGYITDIKPAKKGIKKDGGEWVSVAFKVTTDNGQPEDIWVTMFGAQKIQENPIKMQDHVNVKAFLNTTEYNNQAYANVNAYAIEQVQPSYMQPQQGYAQPQAQYPNSQQSYPQYKQPMAQPQPQQVVGDNFPF